MFNSVKLLPAKVSFQSIRYNSQDSLFLANLLKRIDKATTRAQNLQVPKETKLVHDKTILNKKTGKGFKSNNQFRESSDNQTIQVSNHPLRNTFNQNRGDRFSKFNSSYNQANESGEQLTQRGPREGQFGQRQGQYVRREGAPRTPRDGQRTSRPRQSARPPRKQFVSEIKTKQLKATSLKPEINGDTFLYGKPTSVLPCTTSRVASITKTALLDSKYPYKLPKAIIDQAPTQENNEFVLTKNWSFDLNLPKIVKQVNQLILGKSENINVKEGQDSAALNTELMKNASIGITDKQLMYDIINGDKSPKTLFNDSHWVKNKPVKKAEEPKKVETKKKGKK